MLQQRDVCKDLSLKVLHLLVKVLGHGTLMVTQYCYGAVGSIVRQQLGSYWLTLCIQTSVHHVDNRTHFSLINNVK